MFAKIKSYAAQKLEYDSSQHLWDVKHEKER